MRTRPRPATGGIKRTGEISGCSFGTIRTRSSGATTPGSKFRSARISKTSTIKGTSSGFDWRGPWRSQVVRRKGELGIQYDEVEDTYRAYQPVTIDEPVLDSPLASEEAAVDIDVNNLVACTTTTGEQYLYDGEDLFERFRATT